MSYFITIYWNNTKTSDGNHTHKQYYLLIVHSLKQKIPYFYVNSNKLLWIHVSGCMVHFRVQASYNVRSFGNQLAVLKFLGMQDKFANTQKKQAGAVSLIKRDTNNHPVVESPDDDPLLSALLQLKFGDLQEFELTKGSGVTTQNGDLIHAGQLMKYLNEDGNVNIYILYNFHKLML